MTLINPSEFDALTRTDFQVFVERAFAELNPSTAFADNFHIGVICSKLEAVRRGEIKRLIINLPPPRSEIDHRLGGLPRLRPRP